MSIVVVCPMYIEQFRALERDGHKKRSNKLPSHRTHHETFLMFSFNWVYPLQHIDSYMLQFEISVLLAYYVPSLFKIS